MGYDKQALLGTTPFGHATLLIMSDPDFALQVVLDLDPFQVISDPDPNPVRLKGADLGGSRSATLL